MKLLRIFLALPLLFMMSLAGCTTSSTGAVTVDPQAIADANGIVSTLLAELPVLTAADPNLIPAATLTDITTGLTLAQTSLKSLSSATLATTGATVLIQVEGAVNAALNAITPVLPAAAVAFPVLAPAVPAIQAVAALLPAVEAFINAYLPPTSSTTVAAVRAKAVAPTVTYAAARAKLNIATVQ